MCGVHSRMKKYASERGKKGDLMKYGDKSQIRKSHAM